MKTLQAMAGALLLLGLGFFWVGPALLSSSGEVWANAAYIGIRVVSFVGLSLVLVLWAGRGRFQAMTTTVLVAGIDQIGFRSVLMLRDIRLHPQDWAGGGLGGAIYGTALSFAVFLPLILLMAFLGAAAGGALNRKPLSGVQASR